MTTVSETSVCNMALALLGDERIGALTDNTEAARACNSVYEHLRNGLLRSHPWRFARARANLASLTTTPVWGWSYQFTLPSDPYCLRVLDVDSYKQYEWTVEGRKLLGNFSSANIRYISIVTDPMQFDPLFSVDLSTRIAVQICMRLTSDESLRNMLRIDFNQHIRDARAASGQEGEVESVEADAFADERL